MFEVMKPQCPGSKYLRKLIAAIIALFFFASLSTVSYSRYERYFPANAWTTAINRLHTKTDENERSCCLEFIKANVSLTSHIAPPTLATETSHEKSRSVISSGTHAPDDGEVQIGKKFLQSLFTLPAITFTGKGRYRSLMKLTEEGTDMVANHRPDRPELWKEGPQQLVRRKELRERCSAEELNPLLDLSRMVYDDKHKVVMCVVPKAACTTMKRAMWFLQGNVDKANINQVNTKLLVLGSGKIKTLNLLPKTEALKRLLNYTTFVVMRDPTARIVSAHSSKFTNRTSSPSYKLFYGRQIAMRQAKLFSKGVKLNYRNIVATSNLKMDPDFQRLSTDEQQEVIDYAKIMRFGNISFHQFGRFVSQQNVNRTKSFDVHWRPQVDLCNPCLFNYDYVIKFENLATEANALLGYLQRNDPEEEKYFVDETHNPLIDDEKTRKAFDGIGNDVLDGLERIYARDFKVWGYKTSFNSFKNIK